MHVGTIYLFVELATAMLSITPLFAIHEVEIILSSTMALLHMHIVSLSQFSD